jgi:hypothetical protein
MIGPKLESEKRGLSGAMAHTFFGKLNGVYTFDCDHMPSESEIRDALHRRIMRDCGQSEGRSPETVLTAWHGGWTREGIGIFCADICGASNNTRARRLGSACVDVRTPRNSGSRTWKEWPIELFE